MKNKKQISKLIFIYIISLLFSFVLGFFTTEIVNKYNGTYVSSFTYQGNENLDFNNIIDEDFLISVIEKYPSKGLDNIDVKKMLNKNDFTIVQNQTNPNNYTISTKISYYEENFIVSSIKILNRAETFIKYTLVEFSGNSEYIQYDNNKIGSITNTFPSWISGIISLCSGLLITTIIIIIIPKKRKKNDDEQSPYDNQDFFRNPFSVNYFIQSTKELKSVKQIATLAMLFGLLMVTKFISLPSGFGDLGIGFGYVVLGIIGMIYGPFVSIGVGLFSDVIGFFIGNSAYGFNVGYTMQAILACLTYSLCFYRTNVTFSKVFLSRIIVNLILNVLYGSFLMVTIYISDGKIPQDQLLEAYKMYAIYYSLPKNLVYLIPQTAFLFIIIKSLAPVLERLKLIPQGSFKRMTLI